VYQKWYAVDILKQRIHKTVNQTQKRSKFQEINLKKYRICAAGIDAEARGFA
jgi:hypothetical protein